MINKTFNKSNEDSSRKVKAFENLLTMLLELELVFNLSPELDEKQLRIIKMKMLEIFNY